MNADRWIIAMSVGGAAAACGALLQHRPLLVWNMTASAPLGVWRVESVRPLGVGDWALLRPAAETAAWLSVRGYLPRGAPLLKRVAARAGQTVCRAGTEVRIDGRLAARALVRDRNGARLPTWSGCWRLGADAIFVLNPAPDSLDGRYFGPTPVAQVLGRAVLIWRGP